jgi:hypothetical protein
LIPQLRISSFREGFGNKRLSVHGESAEMPSSALRYSYEPISTTVAEPLPKGVTSAMVSLYAAIQSWIGELGMGHGALDWSFVISHWKDGKLSRL